jgi:hypothetical protein
MADEQRQPSKRAADAPGPQPAPAQPGTEPEHNPYRVPLQPGDSVPGQQGGDTGQQIPHPHPPPGYQAPYPQGYQAPYPQPGQQPPYPYAPGQQAPSPYPQAPHPYQQAPYQPPYPYPSGYGYGPPVQPRTETQAVFALVLAISGWLLIPIGPAILALIVAWSAKNSILASQGARSGLGLVSAARWIAVVHLIVLPVGFFLFGWATLFGALF